jgi:hypothetical protein
MNMVEESVPCAQAFVGMPLAWGANAHAGTCHRDSSLLQAAEGQGTCARLDWSSGFLFSWEVPKSQDVVTSFVP